MAGRILDTFSPSVLISTNTQGDLTTLCHVKGLGKKTAQKIILELGKTLVLDSAITSSPYYEVLSSLGFGNAEIESVLQKTELSDLNENQAITALLRSLGGKK
jgi:Holliday junction resolvasome RuvABC DNA-binding subunit